MDYRAKTTVILPNNDNPFPSITLKLKNIDDVYELSSIASSFQSYATQYKIINLFKNNYTVQGSTDTKET